MTIEKLEQYTAAAMNTGVNVNAADITTGPEAINTLPLTAATYNISAGRQSGWTTRYGISPIPGHNSNEDGAVIDSGVMSGYSLRNIVASEQAQSAHATAGFDVYDKRKFILGAAIVQIPVAADGRVVPVVYWLSTRLSGANHQLDLLPSTDVVAAGQRMGVRSHLEAGVGGGTAVVSYAQGGGELDSTFQAIDRVHTTSLSLLRKVPVDFRKYFRWTLFQTQLETNVTDFIAAQSAATPDSGGLPRDAYFGFAGSPYWNNGREQRRNISCEVSLSGSPGLATAPKKWTAKAYFSNAAGDLVGTMATNRSTASTATTEGGVLAFSGLGNATYETSGAYPGAGSTHLFCRVDEQPLAAPVSVLAMVTDRPVVVMFNPLLRDSTEADTTSDATSPPPGGNDFAQWVDPTNNMWKPRAFNTRNNASMGDPYTEAWGSPATARQTCWQNAPLFVYGTVTGNVSANSGTLKANTVYEYAYSIYNTLTGKESNVGVPARAFVAVDNSGILVHDSMNPLMYGAQTDDTHFPALAEIFDELPADARSAVPLNHLSYRIYYREVGSFEWLFAGEHSFASIYFEPFAQAIYIGQTGAIGEVGGQPGGYNDYSDLPVDDYTDVQHFEGRLFWLTKNTVRFSSSYGQFDYPVRNYGSAPRGEFRGMIPHFFPGQASQSGRLVFFTSEGCVEGRFTKDPVYEQVRVSATAQPQSLPVDGSDFTLTERGSETAFSARCAVVAEGILYFMGPTGVFRDDGVQLPVRISTAIEPLYFDAYDKQNTDQFFGYYNKKSREILFFYRPSTNNITANPEDYLTKAWVYSLRTESWDRDPRFRAFGAWSQYGYHSLIDWAQDVDITNFEAQAHAPGVRTMIGVRSDASAVVSRPYYHDDECDGGDYKPGFELMVKEIQKPDASTLRLVLAAGHSTSVLNAIVGGSTDIAVKSSTDYGDMPVNVNVDGFYKVKDKSLVNGTIDLTIKGNLVNVSPKTFGISQHFPIFVQGFHDIKSVIDTNYLAPGGLFTWILSRYMQLLIKPVKRLQGSAEPFVKAEWQGNHTTATTCATKSLSLYPINARETTTQILTDIPNAEMQAEGQAVKVTLTYNQIAGRYTLYLMTHYYADMGSDQIKTYQREFG